MILALLLSDVDRLWLRLCSWETERALLTLPILSCDWLRLARRESEKPLLVLATRDALWLPLRHWLILRPLDNDAIAEAEIERLAD